MSWRDVPGDDDHDVAPGLHDATEPNDDAVADPTGARLAVTLENLDAAREMLRAQPPTELEIDFEGYICLDEYNAKYAEKLERPRVEAAGAASEAWVLGDSLARLRDAMLPRLTRVSLAGADRLPVAMLVVVTFIDIRHYIIPDELSIYAAPLGIAASAGLAWIGAPDAVGLRGALVGSVAGAGVLVSVMLFYRLVRGQDGMGWGDPKLLAMIGAFLGALPALPFVVFVACLAGSVVGLSLMALNRRAGWGMRSAVPFGPFLALGAMVWVLHGPQMISRWFPGVHYLLAVG